MTNSITESLSQQLIIQRHKHQLSQQDLADLLKVEQQTIDNYERQVRQPDLTTLGELGEIFDVEILIIRDTIYFLTEDELFEIVQNPPTPWQLQRGFSTFGEALKQYREKRSVTQKDLVATILSKSEKLESLTPASIANYESGEREPRLETLMSLIEGMECALVIRYHQIFLLNIHQLPPFLTPQEHLKVLQTHLNPIPLNPNEVWSELEECTFESRGYERDYSSFIYPQVYEKFIMEHRWEAWGLELETELRQIFEGYLVDQLAVTDTKSPRLSYTTCLHFRYQDPAGAYQRQQNEIERLLNKLKMEEEGWNTFEDLLPQAFGRVVGDEPLELIEYFVVPQD